jgi:aromatic ring hydroxylase-like protein
LARQRAGAYLNAAVRAEFNIPGITFGARYDASSIIVGDGTFPPPDAANSYTPTACPGGRAPHLWFPNGDSIYDKLGFEFTLLRLGPKPAPAVGLMQAAKSLGMPLTSLDLESADLRDLYGADLVLIRPDQIVAWRGAQAPKDPVGLLGALVGFSRSELRI